MFDSAASEPMLHGNAIIIGRLQTPTAAVEIVLAQSKCVSGPDTKGADICHAICLTAAPSKSFELL